MDRETLGPNESFARDLEELDRALEQRERADAQPPTVDLIAGLFAGLRLVGRPPMSDATPTSVELQVLQLVALWRHGPAVRHDPVLANMFARLTAALNRPAPSAAARVRGTLEDMQARGLGLFVRGQ